MPFRTFSLKQSTKPIEILPQLIAVRLKGIIELIAHPSDRLVKTHYSPKFMEQVPAAILVSMFQQVSLEATSCRMERVLELRDPLSAVVLLNCRGINAEALIAVDAKPPHQIVGFSMRPSPKPKTTPSP